MKTSFYSCGKCKFKIGKEKKLILIFIQEVKNKKSKNKNEKKCFEEDKIENKK
jgi:hypothetical protein